MKALNRNKLSPLFLYFVATNPVQGLIFESVFNNLSSLMNPNLPTFSVPISSDSPIVPTTLAPSSISSVQIIPSSTIDIIPTSEAISNLPTNLPSRSSNQVPSSDSSSISPSTPTESVNESNNILETIAPTTSASASSSTETQINSNSDIPSSQSSSARQTNSTSNVSSLTSSSASNLPSSTSFRTTTSGSRNSSFSSSGSTTTKPTPTTTTTSASSEPTGPLSQNQIQQLFQKFVQSIPTFINYIVTQFNENREVFFQNIKKNIIDPIMNSFKNMTQNS